MACRRCASDQCGEFGTEINIHFPGLAGLDKPALLIFPKVQICARCGLVEFTLAEGKLPLIAGVIEEAKRGSVKPTETSDRSASC